jgi:GT2 family glycosyltransferase
MPVGAQNSFVFVNYNNKKALWGLLGSLDLKHSYLSEVIVVDSASTDGSAEMVEKEFPRARLVVRSHNRGFPSAAMRAIHKAKGSVLVLCHSDVATDLHGLEELADRVRTRNTTGQHVAAAIPRLVTPDGTDQPCVGKLPGLGRGMAGMFNPLVARKAYVPTLDHVADNEWTKLTCMALDAELFFRLGSLDERFFLYWADADLCQRIHERGHRIVIHRDVSVVHAGHSPNDPRPEPLMQIMREDQQRYFEKHRPAWQQKVLNVDKKIHKLLHRESA